MKNSKHLFALLLLLCPFLFKGPSAAGQSNPVMAQKNNHTTHDTDNFRGNSVWGELNAGYSNHGYGGSLGIHFRKGKFFYGVRYAKFHICYDDDKKRKYFLNDGESDQHESIESIALVSGKQFPGKLTPSLFIGISWSQFKYVSTTCIEHNVTLSRIWATIMNKDYVNESLGSQIIHTIGIPVGFKLHFAPRHFAGLETGIVADLNPHCTMISAEIGIRLGKITRSRQHLNP